MVINEKLHAKRKSTEDHIRELESAGNAGQRYTIHMPDLWFMVLGLVCDIGWLIQLIVGIRYAAHQADVLVIADIVVIVVGIAFTIYLGKIHEKEIALHYQKDLSFGLTVLGGIIGIIAGLNIGSALFLAGAILNVVGGLPIYLSFRKGIAYGIK